MLRSTPSLLRPVLFRSTLASVSSLGLTSSSLVTPFRLCSSPPPLHSIRFFHSSLTFSSSSWKSKGPINYKELKPLTQSPSGEITIIDVRESNEVAQGMIPSSVNVPLSKLVSAFQMEPIDFKTQFAFDKPKFNDSIIVYCRSGKRSQQALEFLSKNRWVNVRNYEGSWLDWNHQEHNQNKENDD